jgi:mono/diheme cytochrome c family protein
MLAAVMVVGAAQVRAEDAGAGGAMDVPALWKKNCASCHGEDGKGQTKAGKSKKVQDLTNPDVRAKFDRARMIKSTKDGMKSEDGKELMKPYGEKLSDAEIAALTDYIINTLK